jgi:hypothetical protein
MSNVTQPKPIVELHPKGKKPLSWRKDPVILARLAAVSEMMLRGADAWQIATALEASLATARRDITRVRTLWRENSLLDIQNTREKAIAQYNLIITRAWADYNKKSSPHWLRIVMEAQEKIDNIYGNQAPSVTVVAEADLEEIRKKRWYDKADMMKALAEDESSDDVPTT